MPPDLSALRLDRAHPLREQIYPMIRGLILTGAIRPGEVIDEKAIAAQLNVSRTPVREAVKRLSDEHLVEVVAQSATRAAKMDRREIAQSFLIRRALEMESAAQAARRIWPVNCSSSRPASTLHTSPTAAPRPRCRTFWPASSTITSTRASRSLMCAPAS